MYTMHLGRPSSSSRAAAPDGDALKHTLWYRLRSRQYHFRSEVHDFLVEADEVYLSIQAMLPVKV